MVKTISGDTFVVEEFGVIEIRAFDMRRATVGDSKKFLDGRPAPASLEAFVALPQRLRDSTSDGFAGQFADSFGKAMGFRVLDVQAPGGFIVL